MHNRIMPLYGPVDNFVLRGGKKALIRILDPPAWNK